MAKYLDTTGVSHLGGKIDERITKRMGLYVVPHGAVSWDTSTAFSMDVSISNNELLGYMDNARLLVVIEKPNNEEATLFEYQRDGDTGDVYLKSTLDADNTYMYANLHLDDTYATIDGEIRSDIADALTELDTKANFDGSYDDMTVGNTKQLLGTVGVDDQTPYNFRTSGGSVDIGDREKVKAIVGGTVAWNQMVGITNGTKTDRGITASLDATSGVVSLSGTSTATYSACFDSVSAIKDHVYLREVDVLTNPNNISVSVAIGAIGTWRLHTIKANSSGLKPMIVVCPTSTLLDGITLKAVVLDITLMFGSTIADYIDSLEQATAGAGVAWFRKLFPKSHYAYNAGELMSVKTSAHNMVGFNAYDPETGKAKVVGGNQYQITGSYTSLSLDGAIITPDTQGLFTPSTNGELIVADGNATDTCIHLVWSGYRNGEYEEYALHSYPLDSELELRGIPKLDASNNLYYDGDEYKSDGTVFRRYGVVDMGTLPWSKPTATDYMNFASNGISGLVKHPTTTSAGALICLCQKYIHGTVSATADGYIYITAQGQIRVKDTTNAALTAAEFKALMSGVYLIYELATPTAETAEPYQETQVVNDFGTEEYVDYAVEQGLRDVAIPVGSITEYLPNLRDKLQNAPNNPPGSGLWVVQRIDGANVYIPLATALQMINNGEDPTEEVEA